MPKLEGKETSIRTYRKRKFTHVYSIDCMECNQETRVPYRPESSLCTHYTSFFICWSG